MEISLYVHIPFCAGKCHYCDFYSVPYDESLARDFVAALDKEWSIVSQDPALCTPVIKTVFFGGGTPSILPVKLWEDIRDLVMRRFSISPGVEWTVECNPESFAEEKTDLWLSMGVTRLTFGVQSLNDEELLRLGRHHTARQALCALESPGLSEFKSIGIDLMYGLPGQTLRSFRASVERALSLPFVRHLSAYELTISGNTPFGRDKNLVLPHEDVAIDMARALFRACRENGFERYEISNFARPGHHCIHNEAYWNHSPYVGLGPAAHSFVGGKRWANTADVRRYVSLLKAGDKPVDFEETIAVGQKVCEMIMLRLRTAQGLDEDAFAEAAGEDFCSGKRKQFLENAVNRGLAVYRKPRWVLTEEGMLVADAIIRTLII